MESTLSEPFNVERGVPQGTRLGPLLYNIFTADLTKNIKIEHNERIQTYADDTLVSYRSLNVYQAAKKVGEKVEEIGECLQNWDIHINAEKTNCMLARPHRKNIKGKISKEEPKLRVFGETIPCKSDLKYLGVTFVANGKFNKHAKNMALRGRRLTGATSSLLSNKSIKHKVKKVVYSSLIRSSVTYASAVWATEKNIQALEKMERWAFRFALGAFRKEEDKHFIRNEIIYRDMDVPRIDEFIKKCRLKHQERMATHRNPLVVATIKDMINNSLESM